MRSRGLGVCRASLVAFAMLAAAGAPAPAQTDQAGAAGDPSQGPVVEVALVRQDQSDCTNSDVSDKDPSLLGGTVWVNRKPDGITSVKVSITAKPNTTYRFFLKCVRLLGDITTHDEGDGNGAFEFPTNAVGPVFAFDMYPDGAPSGNKYQSVQVAFR
jgi:hypothetical protein